MIGLKVSSEGRSNRGAAALTRATHSGTTGPMSSPKPAPGMSSVRASPPESTTRLTRVPHAHTIRSPQADAISVGDLVRLVREGRVRVPEFQRGLRWRESDNVKLFDSILRGYPIGSLLVWKHPEPVGNVKVGLATIAAPEVQDAWSLVDGQQRVTAIAGALIDLPNQDPKFRLRYLYDPPALITEVDDGWSDTTSVPLAVLADSAAWRRWVRTHDIADTHIEAAEQVISRILAFKIPVYIVEAEDPATLREIFTRLNATGARMTAVEVFAALRGGKQVESGQLDLGAISKLGELRSFGAIDPADALKVVLAASGLDPSRRPDKLAAQELEKLLDQERIEQAWSQTLSLVMEEAGIPHARLLPYPVILPILTRFFARHQDPEPWNRQRLVRWIWRGAITGVHQRAEVSRMREAVRAISDDESASVSGLLHTLPGAPTSGWELRRFHSRNARARLEVLALLDLGPLPVIPHLAPFSITAREVIDPDAIVSHDRLAPEIIASAMWSRLDSEAKELAQTAANRALIHDRHTGTMVVLKEIVPEVGAEVLASHAVTPEAHRALREDDLSAFLKLRAATLTAQVEGFLVRRAAWDTPQIPPLHTYLSSS